MKRLLHFAALLLLTGLASTSQALIGIGFHYGLDYTMSMSDKLGDAAVFKDLKVNVASFTGAKPAGLPTAIDNATTITGNDLPVFIDRTGWKNTGIDYGGKIYIDAIPFIDGLELSTNFGVWEYHGRIRYPTGLTWHDTTGGSRFMDYLTPVYDTTDITLDKMGLGYFGLKETPYAKLNFDLTIKKYIVQFPPGLKTLRLYGGGGLSCIFATPALSADLIQKAIGGDMNKNFDVNLLNSQLFDNTAMVKKIGDQIINNLMTPHYGLHLDLGVMVKIPIIPIAVYVDGKFMLPFGDMDPSVKELTGYGLMLNGGIALHF